VIENTGSNLYCKPMKPAKNAIGPGPFVLFLLAALGYWCLYRFNALLLDSPPIHNESGGSEALVVTDTPFYVYFAVIYMAVCACLYFFARNRTVSFSTRMIAYVHAIVTSLLFVMSIGHAVYMANIYPRSQTGQEDLYVYDGNVTYTVLLVIFIGVQLLVVARFLVDKLTGSRKAG